MTQGLIVKNISNLYTVKIDKQYFDCYGRGKFKNQNIKLLVGDKVLFDQDKKIINDILPRKNELVRPPICNVDKAIIVISVKEPQFDDTLLDKMINTISFSKIKIVICFTKLDLLNDEELKIVKKYMDYYQSIGYEVITKREFISYIKSLKDEIIVLTGQSGVGKSTLLNLLDYNLETNPISKALGRGKHTTRHTELLIAYNCLVADTPGFSSLTFDKMTKEDIRNNFIEFSKYECRYSNCFHINDDECGVIEAVQKKLILDTRYQNYKKFMQEKGFSNDSNSRINSIK